MIALLSEKWESPQILSRQNEMFHVEHFCNCPWNSDSPRRKPVQVSLSLGNTLLTQSPCPGMFHVEHSDESWERAGAFRLCIPGYSREERFVQLSLLNHFPVAP